MPEFVIALLELLEAEGRAFRRAFGRASFGAAILFITTILVLTGLGFLLASGYLALVVVFGRSLSALMMGSASLLIAAVLGFLAYRAMR
ncbi:MAG: hypothetical protein ACYC3A_07800 [Halothiobacillus sp.]